MQIDQDSFPAYGSSSDPLSNLAAVLERARVHCGVRGMSVSVVHKGEIIFAKGFGKRNKTELFNAETLVPVASITKAFTAAAIGELVAEGKMDWDKTPVHQYLPDFKLKDPVLNDQLTMDDLLSHRTGVPDLDFGWYRTYESQRDLIKRLRHVDVTTPVRSKFIYNNVMYAVAGEAAAAVSGISYENLVETKVLQPLGMPQSGFSAAVIKTKPNHATPHVAASFEDAQQGIFEEVPLDEVPMRDAPAGDLHSNVIEMAAWARAMMHQGKLGERQVLNEDSIDTILSAHSIMEPKSSSPEFGVTNYGLGWMLDTYKGQVVHRHTGSIIGFRSSITLFPNSDLAVIHLTNTLPTELPVLSAYYIADLLLGLPKTQDWLFTTAVTKTKEIYQGMAGAAKGDFPKQIPGRPANHALEDYVGDFSHPVFGDMTIRKADKDSLVVAMRTLEGKMEHLHYDLFKVVLRDFGVVSAALLSFKTGADGRVSLFELLDPSGEEDGLPMVFKKVVVSTKE